VALFEAAHVMLAGSIGGARRARSLLADRLRGRVLDNAALQLKA
jgi:hypothetical protein